MGDNLHDDQESVETLSSSSSADDFFEFFQGGLSDYSKEKMMSHAEDIIFCGKLVPINQQLHRKQPPQQSEKHNRRNQHNSLSLGYKKLRRNSSMSSEPKAEIGRDGSRKKLSSSSSSSSSRRRVILSGLVNVPQPEMNIRDLKNRQVRMNIASSELVDVVPVSRSVDHRKRSWKVLEFLSCKSSRAVVMTPLGYIAKV